LHYSLLKNIIAFLNGKYFILSSSLCPKYEAYNIEKNQCQKKIQKDSNQLSIINMYKNINDSLSGSFHKYSYVLFIDFYLQFEYDISYEKGDIMPRKSPFKIILTNKEQDHLSSLARKYTAPYRDVIRAQVILLAAKGIENKEIGERLNLPRKTVSKWRKRFFYEREQGLVDKPRAGRPFFFSP